MPNTKKRGRVPREDVVKAIISGIKKAHKDYSRMSGGIWVGNGPEYWVTTHVANKLSDLCGDGVVVAEANSNKMMSAAGRGPGRTPLLVHHRRFDIALYFSKGGPRAVIEIKNQQQKSNLLEDVKRVLAALRVSSLWFGAVAYYYSAQGGPRKSAEEKVKDYARKFSENAAYLAAGDACSAKSKFRAFVEDGDAWLAGCTLLERKPGNKRR